MNAGSSSATASSASSSRSRSVRTLSGADRRRAHAVARLAGAPADARRAGALDLSLGDYLELGNGSSRAAASTATPFSPTRSSRVRRHLPRRRPGAGTGVIVGLYEALRLSTRARFPGPKTQLRNTCKNIPLPLPSYHRLGVAGEPHSQKFVVQCHVAGLRGTVRGEGAGRRRAEQQARGSGLRTADADADDGLPLWHGWTPPAGRMSFSRSDDAQLPGRDQGLDHLAAAATTRHRLPGIKTDAAAQIIYVDTPGLHPWRRADASGHLDHDRARQARRRGRRPAGDFCRRLDRGGRRHRRSLVTGLARWRWFWSSTRSYHVPGPRDAVAADRGLVGQVRLRRDRGVRGAATTWTRLERALIKYLPAQPRSIPPDQITDRSERFLAAELVREQVFRCFGEEVPYAVAVQIRSSGRRGNSCYIDRSVNSGWRRKARRRS